MKRTQALVRVLEARVDALEARMGIYSKLVDSRLSEKRRAAGLKSAEMRIKKLGSANPRVNKTRIKPNKTRTNVNKREQNSETIATAPEANLEAIFKLYPKRDGDQRKRFGFNKIGKELKTEADWADFKRAVEKYAKDCARKGVKGSYVMQFGTFCGDRWREYAELAKGEALKQTEKLALRFDDEVEW